MLIVWAREVCHKFYKWLQINIVNSGRAQYVLVLIITSTTFLSFCSETQFCVQVLVTCMYDSRHLCHCSRMALSFLQICKPCLTIPASSYLYWTLQYIYLLLASCVREISSKMWFDLGILLRFTGWRGVYRWTSAISFTFSGIHPNTIRWWCPSHIHIVLKTFSYLKMHAIFHCRSFKLFQTM